MRCTFLVLIGAITKGADHLPRSSSYEGIMPEGWSGPSKPGVSAKGLRSTPITETSLAAAFIVAPRLAAVPPEKVPCIARTRPRMRGAGLPKRSTQAFWVIITPRSKGIESKPDEKQMRAPLASAAA